MPMHYAFIDGYWVRCATLAKALIVGGCAGGQVEPYGFHPSPSGSLEISFDVWLRNILAAAKAD